LVVKGILKFNDSQRKIIGGQIITYIRVGVGDVSRRFAHDAKASEVAWLAFDLLILLWARWFIAGKVKVAKGSTCSRHHLLKLLLVPQAVLLPVVILVIVVLFGVVILVGGGVGLLPLGAVGDEVSGVAALEVAPRRSAPFLAELVQDMEFSR
jgi:hypothetical protein